LEIGDDDMAKRPTSRTKAKDPEEPAAPAAPKAKRARATAPRPAEPVDASAETADAPAEPSADDIRRRAYERYQQRGGNHGQHFDDWLAAEQELRSKK
jgi:hypothetical protein